MKKCENCGRYFQERKGKNKHYCPECRPKNVLDSYVHFRLTSDEKARFELYCKRNDLTKQEFLRSQIQEVV